MSVFKFHSIFMRVGYLRHLVSDYKVEQQFVIPACPESFFAFPQKDSRRALLAGMTV
jgi:hypothetical protein